MKKIILKSPAKVNLVLRVVGKRPDGYHDLKMVMTRISLSDEITLTLKSGGITLACDNPSVPKGDKNIAWRAAKCLLDAKGLKTGVHIDLKKRIPMGGGLGGGSSNAASVLMGLNELTGLTASLEELMDIGVKLGADVPFFIFKGPALAEGVGERLTMIDDLPELWLVLVNPGLEIPTASIFESLNLRLTKPPESFNISGFHSLSGVLSNLHNDLEEVTFKKYPEVEYAKKMVLKSGAAGALMSGSGSTVFGICADRKAAERVLANIGNKAASRGWAAFTAHSL